MCVGMCPIQELTLDHVYSFNGVGMEVHCSAQNLGTRELVRCQEIRLAMPSTAWEPLSSFGVSGDGWGPLIRRYKLEFLAVEDCPQISERGVQGAARYESFRQDLSWITGRKGIPKQMKLKRLTNYFPYMHIHNAGHLSPLLFKDLQFQKHKWFPVSFNLFSSAVLKDLDMNSVSEDGVNTRL
ncbi:hypothetical protein NC653_003306 [Populus alba x Populus x berolinensis]|uniref:Uncharacterized protein n=1 Tax=Populus alba x Populus x berolinensis TaxID=444605 RepID=A0AAD6RS83_9ROSI|nr:hypothetical protein NC653_003299 [Populus alba x Populus x berolinensis]KAJ7013604.1 hypothetical protein NC653_003302 [Populus alba x Populus x berolinensis]KAJ7013609.1 hypothetical protein NC653_003306 [Populus alba x Populus x berolinensis]